MQYRHADKNDIKAINSLNRANMPENYDRKTYEMHMELYPTLNWVAVSDVTKQITGYVLTHVEDRVEAHITSIAVDSNYRRAGIGKRLLINALVSAKKMYLLSCSLHVRVSNEAAIKLYESLNFNKIRIKEKYYEDGEDAYLMRRQL